MRYSFKRRGNRGLYLLSGAAVLLTAATLITPLIFPGLIGLGIALIAGYLAYQVIRFLIRHLRSNILTHDDGLTFLFPSGTVERLRWEEITHAGTIRTSEGTTVIFIYAEGDDRLATIPEEYEKLDQLMLELKQRVAWYELEQQEGESLEQTILPLTEGAQDSD